MLDTLIPHTLQGPSSANSNKNEFLPTCPSSGSELSIRGGAPMEQATADLCETMLLPVKFAWAELTAKPSPEPSPLLLIVLKPGSHLGGVLPTTGASPLPLDTMDCGHQAWCPPAPEFCSMSHPHSLSNSWWSLGKLDTESGNPHC